MKTIHSDYSYKNIDGAETIQDDDPLLVEYIKIFNEKLSPKMEMLQSKKDMSELKAGEYLLQ